LFSAGVCIYLMIPHVSTVLDLSIALESIDENHEIMEHGSRIKINNITERKDNFMIFSVFLSYSFLGSSFNECICREELNIIESMNDFASTYLNVGTD
jgi:hypothetical protein